MAKKKQGFNIAAHAKAIVAFLAPVLTYIGGQLAIGEPITWPLAVSYFIGAALVWAVPNAETGG